MTAEAAPKAATMITDGQGLRICSRGIRRARVLPHLSIVSMTGYWNAYKLDIPMQSPMAMVMAMMSSERKPPSMPPSQDEAHTVIGVFTEIAVSNSDNDRCLFRVTSARLNGRMPDIPEVEIWRTLSLWMFLLPHFFSSVYFFTPLDLGPVQMASARVITTFGDKSSGGGVSPRTRSAEWLPYGTDRLWALWVRTFAYVEQLFDCFLSFSPLVPVYAAHGVCT